MWATLSMLAVSYFFYRKLGKSYDIESANGKNLLLLLEREKQLKEKLQLELVESKESANRAISVLTTKYAHIIDIDSAVEDARKIKDEIEFASIQLNNNYRDKKTIFDQLVAQAAIYDEEVMLAELGFYKPHFDFDTSEKYKEAIELNNLQQKDLISKNKAVYCAVQWTVEGSKTKGDAFSKRIVKLTARAFNNECDASIANVRWNNVQRIEQRITKAFAPTLENELHKIFAEKRINLVNYRKEFFNVTLDEIQKAVETKAPKAEFYITAEAREHRESLAIRAQREHKKMIGDPRAAFPDAISEVTA